MMHLAGKGTRILDIKLLALRNPSGQDMEKSTRVKRPFSNEQIVWPHKLKRLSSSNKLSTQIHFKWAHEPLKETEMTNKTSR